MAKIDFHNIEKAEKEAIFNAIATEKGMTPFAVEKDWWAKLKHEISLAWQDAKGQWIIL